MTETASGLTQMYFRMKQGDEAAVEELWRACSSAIIRFADKQLRGVSQKMAGPEDVCQEAFVSFIKAARLERFPQFHDRNDLWRLLFTITKRKAIDLQRYERHRKVSGESIFWSNKNEKAGIHDIPGEPTEKASAALFSESLEELLKVLDPSLHQYALAKLEGYTNTEIAEMFDVALRTVERKLHRVRRAWMNHVRSD